MGMYTQVFTSLQIPAEKEKTIVLLDSLINGSIFDDTLSDLMQEFSHPFFKLDRWSFIFGGDDSYFNTGHVNFVKNSYSNSYKLTLLSALKNYNSEIDYFFDWIANEAQNIYDGSFLGFSMYEEDEEPTHYFAHDNLQNNNPAENNTSKKFTVMYRKITAYKDNPVIINE